MKVTLVGTGCTWYARNNTSFIIDNNMLFDISSGNYKHVIKSLDIFDLDAIFISHLHTDHVGDLIIITTRLIRESKKRGITKKLRVYGPKGLAQFLVDYATLCGGADEEKNISLLKSTIDFYEVYDGFEFNEGKYKVKTYKMNHGKMDCYGYSFADESGKIISFSADTCRCENLEKMLKISDVAFVDMAAVSQNIYHIHVDGIRALQDEFINCQIIPVHFSDQAMEIAKNYNMKLYNDGDILNF